MTWRHTESKLRHRNSSHEWPEMTPWKVMAWPTRLWPSSGSALSSHAEKTGDSSCYIRMTSPAGHMTCSFLSTIARHVLTSVKTQGAPTVADAYRRCDVDKSRLPISFHVRTSSKQLQQSSFPFSSLPTLFVSSFDTEGIEISDIATIGIMLR